MRKFFLSLMVLYLYSSIVLAQNVENFKYEDIKLKSKILYNQDKGIWDTKPNKNSEYFYKTNGFGNYYDYNNKDGSYAFSTNCDYEFIINGLFIGYSNKDLNFYEIKYVNNKLEKTALSVDEVKAIFPDYKVVTLSEFSPYTTSIKVRKDRGELKLILLNDTEKIFDEYEFMSGNAKYAKTPLKGCVHILSKGMVEFSSSVTTKESPMYVIIVR